MKTLSWKTPRALAGCQPEHSEATPVVENIVAELLWAFPDDVRAPGLRSGAVDSHNIGSHRGQRGRLLMLHAAGIADPSGQVLAFIGPSGRGKTTLARELGASTAMSPMKLWESRLDGTVHPYRKPLSVIQPGEIYKAQVAPSDLGLGGLPTASLALAGLVLVSRRDGFSGAPRH